MRKQPKQTPVAQAAAPAQAATPMPTVATLPAAPAAKPAKQPTVALRGGPAVQSVALTGNPYRTGCAHNAAWWATLTAALANGPAPVAPLLQGPQAVPSHFVGYAIRRGYLKATA